LSRCNPVLANLNIFLSIGQFYQVNVIYTIRDGYYCGEFRPLISDEYVVIADVFIEGHLLNIGNKLEDFIFYEWYKLHIGKTPKLDWFPNKYKYPIISVIE